MVQHPKFPLDFELVFWKLNQYLIVPERIGNISPRKIAREVLCIIKNKDQLKSIRDNLHKERGDKGAAEKLASIIVNSIKKL